MMGLLLVYEVYIRCGNYWKDKSVGLYWGRIKDRGRVG